VRDRLGVLHPHELGGHELLEALHAARLPLVDVLGEEPEVVEALVEERPVDRPEEALGELDVVVEGC